MFLQKVKKRALFRSVCCGVLVYALLAAAVPAAGSPVSAKTSASAYQEPYRPQFHYTPAANWMNDPNGLVYNEETGEYHLFYQYCATMKEDQSQKYWGHAVSKDLVYWNELPAALAPDELGSIWSGSAVIDRKNTSGLFSEDTPAGARMVALFTYAGGDTTHGYEKQGLAYSEDNGVTWKKYEDNPILPSVADDSALYPDGFRDPKVIWYEDDSYENGGIWLMVVAGGSARLFASPDLIHWTYQDTLRYRDHSVIVSECPDFYPISVEGRSEQKWVFSGAGRFYVVGDLKEEGGTFSFRAETDQQSYLCNGTELYASQTFSNVPDGRRIAFLWMIDLYSQHLPTESGKVWEGVQSLPMELKLSAQDGGYRMTMNPVQEINGLRTAAPLLELSHQTVGPGTENILKNVSGRLLDIEAVISLQDEAKLEFRLRMGGEQKTVLGYNAKTNNMGLIRRDSGPAANGMLSASVLPDEAGTIKLRILVDSSVVDVFANEGAACLNALIFPDSDSIGLEFVVRSGQVVVESLRIYEMQSIWTDYVPPENDGTNAMSSPTPIPQNKGNFSIGAAGTAALFGGVAAVVACCAVVCVKAGKKKAG